MSVPALSPSASVKSLGYFVGMVPANYNMIPSANDLTGGLWVLGNASVTSAAGLGPDGVTQSQKLKENGANSEHRVIVDTSGGPGIGTSIPAVGGGGVANLPMRFAVVAKSSGRTRIVLKIATGFFVNSVCSMGFDLAGGNTNYDGVTDARFTIIGQAMRSLGDGWWLCTFDARSTALDFQVGGSILLDNGSGTAARSTTYIGDAVSGVQIWYANLLPMAAWTTFSRQAYFDDFNSADTIDINDTQAPGFNWYPHNRWPLWPDVLSSIPTAPTTPSSAISVANSILTFSFDVSGYASGLMSACVDPNNNASYVGAVFSHPAIYEARIAIDPALTAHYGLDYVGSVPAVWANGVSGLTGTDRSIADNVFEPLAGPFNYQTTIFDFQKISQVPISPEIETAVTGLLMTGITDFKRLGSMIFTATTPNTNGVGCRLHFHEGVFVTNSVWPWAAAGDFSFFNTESKALIIGAGTEFSPGVRTWPLAIDWLRVIQ